MSIERLNWDSQFFGLEIGCANQQQLKDAPKETDKYDLIYLKENNPIKEEIGFYNRTCFLADCKRVYSKLIITTSNLVVDYKIKEYKDFPIPLEELYKLAYLSGTYSRYHIDKHFVPGKFEEMYRAWVDNSISGDLADYLFYIKTVEGIGAFVTLKVTPQKGIIGLIATNKKVQSKGMGRALVAKCEEILWQNGIKQLDVVTQADNKIACLFYEKCGMQKVEETYIYHCWKCNETTR